MTNDHRELSTPSPDKSATTNDCREWTVFACHRCGLLDPADCGRDFDCGFSDMKSREIAVIPSSWRDRAERAEERAATLAEAIQTHRNAIQAEFHGETPNGPDARLWAALAAFRATVSCPTCGGRGWHTAGGNEPSACGSCPAGEAWHSGTLAAVDSALDSTTQKTEETDG